MMGSKPIAPSDIPDISTVDRSKIADEEDCSDRAKIELIQLRERGLDIVVRKEWISDNKFGPLIFAYFRKDGEIIRECLGPARADSAED